MNELPWQKRAELKRLLALGMSYRTIADHVGCVKNTVMRYAAIWQFSVTCACGRPAGHNGWCKARLEYSPNRRGWLAKQWEKRGRSELAAAIDDAERQARDRGHRLGRWVWGSSGATAMTYALCAVCGKAARVNDGARRREATDGTALRELCLSADERAAQKAAAQEKKQWRSVRRTLTEIRRHLRPQVSRTTASTPGRTSHE